MLMIRNFYILCPGVKNLMDYSKVNRVMLGFDKYISKHCLNKKKFDRNKLYIKDFKIN